MAPFGSLVDSSFSRSPFVGLGISPVPLSASLGSSPIPSDFLPSSDSAEPPSPASADAASLPSLSDDSGEPFSSPSPGASDCSCSSDSSCQGRSLPLPQSPSDGSLDDFPFPFSLLSEPSGSLLSIGLSTSSRTISAATATLSLVLLILGIILSTPCLIRIDTGSLTRSQRSSM